MKTVIITGASRRLGLFLTKSYFDRGWSVFAVTRKISKGLRALMRKGAQVLEIDGYSASNACAVSSRVKSEAERVDLLINNASLFIKDGESKADRDAFNAFYETQVLFPYLLAEGLYGVMYSADNPSSIINITDIFSVNPDKDYLLYCSTKAGLSNLTLGLAKKYAGGIRVNEIAPGPIKFLPEHSNARKKKVLEQALIKREGGFLPILQTIDFIVDNDYLTAATINVDGGRSVSDW